MHDGGPPVFELFAGPFRAGELAVVTFRGREELSQLYAFDVDVLARDVDELLVDAAILGLPAMLRMHPPGSTAPRTVHGIISSIRHDGPSDRWKVPRLRLRLVPSMWLLRKRINTRIFQDKKVDAIVDKVLGELGIRRSFRLNREYTTRAYCVQYQETDLTFVTRVLAHEGIMFYFEQPPVDLGPLAAGIVTPGETVVFIDGAESYPSIADGLAAGALPFLGGFAAGLAVSPQIPYRDPNGPTRGEEHVGGFSRTTTIQSRSTFLRDFDFQRPSLDLSATADASHTGAPALPTVHAALVSGGTAFDLASSVVLQQRVPDASDAQRLEVYLHHGEYEEADVERSKAIVYLEQHRLKASVGVGQGTCMRFTTGHRFTLSEHPSAPMNEEYVLTRVIHTGRVPEWLGGERGQSVYENEFRCVPARVPFRPRRPARIFQQVVETATVVGEAGQEISTDGYGRIKVQFHWDREDSSSCWIRTAQAWGGAAWGTQFVPRVGMEVVVSFLGGDQDRPVVLGCLYNGEHPPSFPLPREKTRSGLRTQSTPGGEGYNELSFDDAAGSEQVYLRAQRDLVRVVLNDESSRIQNDQSVRVERDQQVTVVGDQREEVLGKKSETVKGDRVTTVEGGDQSLLSGDALTRVGGKWTQTVGADVEQTVTGSLTVNLSGGETKTMAFDQITRVERDAQLRVAGTYRLEVGSEGDDGDTGLAALSVKGDTTLEATGTLKLKAGKGISLEVGDCTCTLDADGLKLALKDTVLELTKDDIYATSKKVTFIAKDEFAVKSKDDSFFKLTKDGEMSGEKVKLYSQAGALELDTNASLAGSQVKLNCGKGQKSDAPEEKEQKQPEQKKHKLRIVLKDEEGNAYASKKYVLTVDGKEFPEATTTGAGLVEQEIPKTAQSGSILLTVAPGETVLIPLVLTTLPKADTVSGAKARLRNLGYFMGNVDDNLDSKTWMALKEFQKTHDLEPTGQLDRATQSKLEELHDNH